MIVSLLRARSVLARFRPAALPLALLAATISPLATAQAGAYSQIIVFGDSLSDTGNFAHVTKSDLDIYYPSSTFNYSNYRFTNSSSTHPSTSTYIGVWHEQLAKRFLNLPAASNSLDGGLDYAYGDAKTTDGTTAVTEGPVTITINNMGQQITDFLSETNNVADGNALYIVWGGANDLFNDYTDANVSATATRVGALVTRLANAGARNFIVPNLPPLGDTPEYNTDATVSANLNQASSDYATDLTAALDSTVAALKANGITVTITRLDVYNLFLKMIADSTAFGFTDTRNSAQGEDVNVTQSLFWDDVHPTTAGHNQIAQFAADILPGGHPEFFAGEAVLDSGDFAYLAFPDGKTFGYYTYQFYPYLYSTDLGFEYTIPSGTNNGIYFYDFGLKSFLYTSPTLYPYFYEFNESNFYYYFPNTTAPRVFYDFATKQYVYSDN